MPRVSKPKPVRGLFERKPGSGMWSARFTQVDKHGHLRKYVKAFGTDRQAALIWLKLEPGRVRAAEGLQPIHSSDSTVSVADLCDDWLAHVQAQPDQYKDQRNPPRRVETVKKQFGDRLAATLRPYEIADWIDSLPGAPATKNKMKFTLSAIYQHGKSRDKVQVNPARDVKSKRVGGGVIRFLTPEEETRIRKVLEEDVAACPDGQPTIRKRLQHRIHELDVSLGTGMRKGEQYKLVWDDIDFTLRTITVRDTKNGESRLVPMIDDVLTALKAVEGLGLNRKDRSADRPNTSPKESVFFVEDNHKWWLSVLKRAKVKNYRWHDNRHTFCSRLAQSGASLKVIQEAAGHKTIQMSARYAHLHQTHLADAMAVLNRGR